MTSIGLTTLTMVAPYARTDRATATTAETAPATPAWQKAQDALDLAKRMADEGEDTRKASAKERIDRVKAQLAYLKQAGFPPDVLLRQLRALGAMLAGAAQDFAASLAGSSASGATPPTTMVSASAMTDDGATSGVDEAKNTVPWGYAESRDSSGKAADRSDREAIQEARALAAEIKAMMAAAARAVKQDKENGPTDTRSGDLDMAMTALTTAANGTSMPTFVLTV